MNTVAKYLAVLGFFVFNGAAWACSGDNCPKPKDHSAPTQQIAQ